MAATIRLSDLAGIVLASGHSAAQGYAADQLGHYIALATGVTLKIIVEDAVIPECCFIVGDHPAIERIAPEIDVASLGDDGFWIRAKDRRVIIAGSKVRGAIYGAYTFLERHLGIKFLAPEVVHVPKGDPKFEIREFSMKEVPAFAYRAITYLEAMDPDFCPTQKINLSPFAEREKGGSYRFSPGKMTHTFYSLVPPDKYFKEHPEYFSLVNGERRQALGQLCLTNPDVVRIASETVIKWFEEEPDIITVGIVQNDWTGYCECENCRKVDRGNPARTLLQFCVLIASVVKDKFPGKFIHTIAYTYTENYPDDWHEQLPDNMIVVVCNMYPYRSNKPIDGDPMNAKYYKNLLGWLKISRHVFVWHYFVDFTHYLAPYPIWKTVAADLKQYRALGVEGVLLQAGIGLGLYQELQELKMWVFHKLLWDPDLDMNVLVHEFLKAYYGKAAPLVHKFIDSLMSIEDRPDVSLHLYVGLEGNHAKKDWVIQCQGWLEQALDAVKDDPATLERVEKVLLGLDYAYLYQPVEYEVLLGKVRPADLERRKQVLARFVVTTEKYKIRSHGEQVPISAFLDRQGFICKEHNVLAIAELAPLVYKMMESMLDKVKETMDEKHYFKENDFVIPALKRGFNPLELVGFMTSKRFAVYEPGVPDNWHRWLDVETTHKLLNPPVPNVRRSQLPALVLGMIKGLPGQKDELDE
ncbi:MAG: DUF4838 domain-containing protein [Candidatus Lokiarchaeota archaeon]|nr:DUF4838 domain-containing protein [Candidatus Lokiarchaeota archaeon]